MQRKTITETAKDALKAVNDVASKAALKGVEGTEKGNWSFALEIGSVLMLASL